MKRSGVMLAGWIGLVCLVFSACGGQESEKDRRAKIESDESVEVVSTTEDDSQKSNEMSEDDFSCPS